MRTPSRHRQKPYCQVKTGYLECGDAAAYEALHTCGLHDDLALISSLCVEHTAVIREGAALRCRGCPPAAEEHDVVVHGLTTYRGPAASASPTLDGEASREGGGSTAWW